jgi:hypothetical protein
VTLASAKINNYNLNVEINWGRIMGYTLRSIVTITLLLYTLTTLAENTVIKKPEPRPSHIGKSLWIIGQEVTHDQWPGTLAVVNAPEQRKMALPGQCISVSVIAAGDERDALLKQSTFNFQIKFDGKTQSFEGLHAAEVKRMKPEGGDFVMNILGAAGVNTTELSDMSMASLATFDLAWCIPADAHDGKVRIQGYAILSKGEKQHFDDASLSVSSFATAVEQGTFKDKEEFADWLMSYYRQPNPARVLAAFRLLADDKQAFTINMRTFFVEVLKSSPQAAKDLQARLAGETPAVRGYALHLLKSAGYDATNVVSQLPEREQEFQRRIPPLPDPYDLRVDPEHFDTPQRMDALWSEFLVTGKPRPVRAIADLLLWRDDYKAVKEAREKAKPILTVELGRGVSYAAAGWSLGSFARHHGLIADFIAVWKNDPGTPAVLKEELENLFTNEAFKRK